MVKIIRTAAKRAFTRTRIPGAEYVINQYVGCEHGCKYCYARFMCRWYRYGEWGSWVVVKENLPELVKKENVRGKVYMSSVSDAYQPVEAKLKLTREVLKNMNENINLAILTKSALVLRDMDIFKKFRNIEVGLTINGFERNLKREIEPFSSDGKRRMNALKVLHENGIKNYAFISPIIPHLVDVEQLINETKNFVDFYWFEFLNLRAAGRDFQYWLMQNYPESYSVISNGAKFKRYVERVVDTVKKSNVKNMGISVHYPEIKK